MQSNFTIGSRASTSILMNKHDSLPEDFRFTADTRYVTCPTLIAEASDPHPSQTRRAPALDTTAGRSNGGSCRVSPSWEFPSFLSATPSPLTYLLCSHHGPASYPPQEAASSIPALYGADRVRWHLTSLFLNSSDLLHQKGSKPPAS